MSRRAEVRRILYVQYTDPVAYPPLQHSMHLLSLRGWHVLAVGIESPDLGSRLGRIDGIPVRLMQPPGAGPRRKLHFIHFTAWVLAIAWRFGPEWVYASDPLACPVALLLKRLLGARLLYHEHDSPEPSTAQGQSRRSRKLVYRARTRVVALAESVVVPNADRARAMPPLETRSATQHVVWNCPAPDEVAHSYPGRDRSGLRVVYQGSIGPMRLPLSLVRALAKLPDEVTLRIAGYETVGSKGYVRQLLQLAEGIRVRERVEVLGPMARREMLDLSREGDVGFAAIVRRLADFNGRTMVGASNKVFDYLACGLPLVLDDSPEWQVTFIEAGLGLSCDPEDPGSIAECLGWFLAHPPERSAMGEAGRQRVLSQWNYGHQFAPVLGRLEDPRVS